MLGLIPGRNQKGFTLVEILVSLLILGLILVGLLPLLTMANRIMYQNRDQLVAAAGPGGDRIHLRTGNPAELQ